VGFLTEAETRGLLHVGCGGDPLPIWLAGYKETRLDIDPEQTPHIVGDMRALGDIGKYDAILCQHALEHLYPHEIVPTLEGFRDALNDGGAVLLFVPDLEDVSATEKVLIDAPAGPITGLDLIYGLRKMLKDKPYMAHHTGFTQDTLRQALNDAGFSKVKVNRLPDYAMFGAAVK
jgi:hypothetical protein